MIKCSTIFAGILEIVVAVRAGDLSVVWNCGVVRKWEIVELVVHEREEKDEEKRRV